MRYFAQLTGGKITLWCYLIWYAFFATRYFDPSPALWFTSLGLSGIIGLALILSTANATSRPDRWTLFRLFLMPFCVSSFAALIKGHGFFLVFAPSLRENLLALACCAIFCVLVGGMKLAYR